ncbi:MAG: helix-hairpin-helix domain-containing protein [Bacteroidales bacterium]
MSAENNKREKNSISNTKARGVIILIVLLLSFQVGTFIWNTVNVRYAAKTADTTEIVETANTINAVKIAKIENAKLFKFNPNTITLDSIVLLGFSPKQAQSIVKYRDKGGRFRKREDFAKMYVVSEQKYEILKSWIEIPPDKKHILKDTTKDTTKYTTKYTAKREWPVKDSKPTYAKLKTEWKCNLNTADSAQLVKLYGIGPYFAKKILYYRQRLGGYFVDTKQLLEIEGIDKEKYDNFAKKIFVDLQEVKIFLIEELDKKFMEQHPYIGAYVARGIILYRENKKTENVAKITLAELVSEGILSPDAANRLKLYIK